MLHPLAPVRNDVLEERVASIMSVTRIGELGITSSRSTLSKNVMWMVYLRSMLRLLVTADVLSLPILVTLKMEAISSSEMSFLKRATRRNILKDCILGYICRLINSVALSPSLIIRYEQFYRWWPNTNIFHLWSLPFTNPIFWLQYVWQISVSLTSTWNFLFKISSCSNHIRSSL
jgi:hypothetical protein